jgi:hypothetical protein
MTEAMPAIAVSTLIEWAPVTMHDLSSGTGKRNSWDSLLAFGDSLRATNQAGTAGAGRFTSIGTPLIAPWKALTESVLAAIRP